MTLTNFTELTERLYGLFAHADFRGMKGFANEVPIFIQTYPIAQEDALRQMVGGLNARLTQAGLQVCVLDLFGLVLEELEENGVLDALVQDEPEFDKQELLETLQNYSDPRTYLIKRLVERISSSGAQMALITGAGRVFPFLRTHTVLESLQPQMPQLPVVFFFPGEYEQGLDGGSHLRLFGSIPSPTINNPYYRAINLDHFRL